MALQLTYTTRSGIALTDAYHKVTRMRWQEKQKTGQRIEVCTYPSTTEANDGSPEADKRTYIVNTFDKDHATDNQHKQAYDWLKAHDDFSGASDV